MNEYEMNILHKFLRVLSKLRIVLISTIKNAILLIVIVTTKYIEIILYSIYYDIVHSLDSTTTM